MARLAEVEQAMLSAWRTLERRSSTIPGDSTNAGRLLMRYLDPAAEQEVDEAADKAAVALAHGTDGEGTRPSARGAVAAAEVWEWLYDAPSPHSCLSFLDDEPDIWIKNEGDEESRDVPRESAKQNADKKAIFREMAMLMSLPPTLTLGMKTEPMPTVRDVKLMLTRLYRSSNLKVQNEDTKLVWCVLNRILTWQFTLPACESTRASLLRVIESSEPPIVLEALLILRRAKVDPGWVVPLAKTLVEQHRDEQVRKTAISVLGRTARSSADLTPFMRILIDTFKGDTSSKVRASLFSELYTIFRRCPPELVVELVMLGLQDEDPHVKGNAETLFSKLLHDIQYSEGIHPILTPTLATCLVNGLITDKAKTLLELCVTCITETVGYDEKHLQDLPEELQCLIQEAQAKKGRASQQRVMNDEDWPADLKSRVRCITQLSSRFPDWCITELLPIIKERIDLNVPWQVRGSGLRLLGIIGSNGVKVVTAALQNLDLVYKCLDDPSAKNRQISSWALGKILSHEVEEKHLCTAIEALRGRLATETDVLAAKQVLVSLDEIARRCRKDSLRANPQDIIDGCTILCSRIPVRTELIIPAIILIHSWLQKFEWPLFGIPLDQVISLIEQLPETVQPNLSYRNAMEAIQHVIEMASGMEPHIARICIVLKRAMGMLHNEVLKDRSLRPAESLAACYTTLSSILQLGYEIPESVLSVSEMVWPALSVMEKEEVARTLCIFENMLSFLADMAISAPTPLMRAPQEVKRSIINALTSIITQEDQDNDVLRLALNALGGLAVHTDLIDASTVATCLACNYEPLTTQDYDFESLVHSVFRLGYHFASSIPPRLAQLVLTRVGFLDYATPEEKVDELVGRANLVLHLANVERLPSGELPETAAFWCFDVIDEFGNEPVIDMEDADHEESVNKLKESVSAMMEAVFNEQVLPRKPSEWDKELMDQRIDALESLLSPKHSIVVRLRSWQESIPDI